MSDKIPISIIPNLLNSEVIVKAYDNALSPGMKETGKILSDIIKTARLIFGLPFQLTASCQDRLEKRLKEAIEKVPEENRIKPLDSMTIPIISHLAYLEDGNILVTLFQNLLARAMDKTRVSEAHPAFSITISQLSADEALILQELKFKNIQMNRLFKHVADSNVPKQLTNFENTDFSLEKLQFPNNFDMYISHLLSLNLVTMSIDKTEHLFDKQYPQKQIGNRNTHIIFPTEFGKLFLKACLPL